MRILLAALAFLLLAIPARAENLLTKKLFDCDSTTECTIDYNEGGASAYFWAAAMQAKQTGTRIRVNGPCASACVIFASFARPNVCVTKNARMKIHLGSIIRYLDDEGHEYAPEEVPTDNELAQMGLHKEVEVKIPSYGEDIVEWATREKKISKDPKVFYTMTHKEMLFFWPACKKEKR